MGGGSRCVMAGTVAAAEAAVARPPSGPPTRRATCCRVQLPCGCSCPRSARSAPARTAHRPGRRRLPQLARPYERDVLYMAMFNRFMVGGVEDFFRMRFYSPDIPSYAYAPRTRSQTAHAVSGPGSATEVSQSTEYGLALSLRHSANHCVHCAVPRAACAPQPPNDRASGAARSAAIDTPHSSSH